MKQIKSIQDLFGLAIEGITLLPSKNTGEKRLGLVLENDYAAILFFNGSLDIHVDIHVDIHDIDNEDKFAMDIITEREYHDEADRLEMSYKDKRRQQYEELKKEFGQ